MFKKAFSSLSESAQSKIKAEAKKKNMSEDMILFLKELDVIKEDVFVEINKIKESILDLQRLKFMLEEAKEYSGKLHKDIMSLKSSVSQLEDNSVSVVSYENDLDSFKDLIESERDEHAEEIFKKLDSARHKVYLSQQSAGGSTTEVLAVNNLLVTDKIYSSDLQSKGQNNTPLLSVNHKAGSPGYIECVFMADPGPGAVVRLSVLKD